MGEPKPAVLILRWLCSDAPDETTRQDIAARLIASPGANLLHKVVAQCILELPGRPPGDLRAEVMTSLTLQGFPDVDLSAYFRADAAQPTFEQIENALESLRATTPEKEANQN